MENLEDNDQEIIWIELKKNNMKKVYIGTYYGKQEKETREEIEREYSQIDTQIKTLEKEGPVILTGDFNSKLMIDNSNIKQQQSSNGKYLQELINKNNLKIPSLNTSRGHWTKL